MTSGPLTPDTVLYAGKDMKAYICTYTIGFKKCPCINLQKLSFSRIFKWSRVVII